MATFTQPYKVLDSEMYEEKLSNNLTNPEWIKYNKELSDVLQIDLHNDEGLKLLSGSLQGYPYYAQAYAGHQYGSFVILGDGRALNIGETESGIELQLKGSGRTRFSRRGDGNATLYSMLREYLISEAMYHLHIPTTRSLSIIGTNQLVQRENLHKGAILTRTAKSHIRIGTFEYARVLGIEKVQELLEYSINKYYPNKDYLTFFESVLDNQAKLLSEWMSVGFIHGVLNTDNVLITGESIDFGPCAFMNAYNPSTVFSSIDTYGRYQYQNQPAITSWNLARLAETMIDLYEEKDEAIERLNTILMSFESRYKNYYYQKMSRKLGLNKVNIKLVKELLNLMKEHGLDYTNTFKDLTLQNEIPNISEWVIKWNKLNPNFDLMKELNPIVIPRNHLVEEALNKAAFENDFTYFDALLNIVQHPFDIPDDSKYLESKDLENYKTYCGT